MAASGYKAVVCFRESIDCGNEARHGFRVERLGDGGIVSFKAKRCGGGCFEFGHL